MQPESTPEIEKHIEGPRRVLSVDMLRGITIALMILVNDPGDWGHLFHQLDHAEWNGWTLTDCVFPTFLFVVGTAMVFSLSSRVARGNCRGTLTGHLFARSGRLWLLGLVLTFFPHMHWASLRFYGVLARIAWCALLGGLVLLITRRMRWLALISAVVLVGYWLLLRYVPIPGAGLPVRDFPLLDPVHNLTAHIDRGFVAWTQHWLHTGSLYRRTSDPEGLLSTLPATVTVLLGAIAGVWMRRVGHGHISINRMRLGLLAAGLSGVVAGELWSFWFPINKNLWTSSFVLLMAGLTCIALSLCSWLVDSRSGIWPLWLRIITWPWFVFGSNAIVAYTTSIVIAKIMLTLHTIDLDGARHSFWTLTYQHAFAWHGSNEWTSLTFAVSYVAVCLLPNWWLWNRRIFLKI